QGGPDDRRRRFSLRDDRPGRLALCPALARADDVLDDNGETLGPARADGVQTTSTPESGAVCGDLRLLPRALSMKSRRPLDWGPRLSSSRDLGQRTGATHSRVPG